MISYAYWQSHLAATPEPWGRPFVFMDRDPIVGVLPPGFRFPEKTDFWFPEIATTTESRAGAKLPRCRAAQTGDFPRTGANRDDLNRQARSSSSIRRATRAGASP